MFLELTRIIGRPEVNPHNPVRVQLPGADMLALQVAIEKRIGRLVPPVVLHGQGDGGNVITIHNGAAIAAFRVL